MLDLILITSLTSLGLFISGDPDYALGYVKRLFAASLGGVLVYDGDESYYDFSGRWTGELFKPLWGCPTCMSSFWGVISYLLFAEVSRETLYELPILILSVACLNFVIFNNFVKKWLNG